MALLAPVLSLPGGVPSPAATLGGLPPWQQGGVPAGGNPLLRDVTFQIQPWLLFARHELRAGRLPQWNPHQFAGAPFWSNGQAAPLFPLHLLFDVLPLQAGLVLLPWLRLVAAGCGAWALGRQLGLSRPAALLSALTFALSGMLVSFALFRWAMRWPWCRGCYGRRSGWPPWARAPARAADRASAERAARQVLAMAPRLALAVVPRSASAVALSFALTAVAAVGPPPMGLPAGGGGPRRCWRWRSACNCSPAIRRRRRIRRCCRCSTWWCGARRGRSRRG